MTHLALASVELRRESLRSAMTWRSSPFIACATAIPGPADLEVEG
jgi:hypothetical protein